MADMTEPRRRSGIRRVVVVVPSFFTLANLFFGFWAIVMAFNGNFRWAGLFIVFAGVLDMVDGRIARLSNTGTKFGAELDSLVDVVSFGVAPALLMYFLEFTTAGKFGWVVCYLYVVATALRLARYNVMSHGAPSAWFTGIPSPAAGMTLATFYLFTETAWYQSAFADRDAQHIGVTVLMLLLAALMVSNIKYPRWPRIGIRTWSGIAGLLVHIVIIAGAILAPTSFLFLLGIFYMLGGIVRHMILNLLERGQPAELGEAAGSQSPVDSVPEEER